MADEQVPSPSDGQPIPHPPEHLYGLLGNLPDIDSSFFHRSVWRLAELYGPVFTLNFVSRKTLVIGNYELAKEVMKDDNYEKMVSGGLQQVRDFAGDGLFTAFNHEPNWHKAHRLLMPIFGPMGVRKMLPEMIDISSQMIAKMAFDTIGLCGYGYRFNEFYSEHVHPFATQMAENLTEAGKISLRSNLETKLRYFSAQHYQKNTEAMMGLCREMIADRKKNPQPDRHDLLNTMMQEADPVTGEKLDDENIMYQMITFLIAGHETTSGTMSFLFYHLLKNPDKLVKAQQEVDQVLGDGPLEASHIPKLKYIDACLKEALRVQGPIAGFARKVKKPQMLGGKYYVDKNLTILVSLALLHVDTAVWGSDAKEFKPERMLDMSKVPEGAWKPFGTGARSCIGRAFAEQEMVVAVALILQRFQLEMADPKYDLKLVSTLTVKPDDFRFKVRRRPTFSGPIVALPGSAPSSMKKSSGETGTAETTASGNATDSAVTVLYGSNAGTCKAFANEVEAAAPSAGFRAIVKTLDEVTEDLSKNPLVIICPSYEGKPPENAKKLVSWLESKQDDKKHLKNVRYSVFGVGNSEWVTSYHKVPKFIDEALTTQGATKICPSAFSDIKENAIGDWEEWLASFWASLRTLQGSTATVGRTPSLKAEVIKSGTPALLAGNDLSFGIIRENREIADTSVGPAKRHIEVELSAGTSYQTGDYLVVQPLNPIEQVQRVLRHFGLHSDDLINVQGTNKAYLLSDVPKTAYEFFAARVDLANVVTQRQLKTLASNATDQEQKAHLEYLGASHDQYKNDIQLRRVSVLDALEDYPSAKLALSEYIDMLKPLAPRQYSISSYALAFKHDSADATNPNASVRASITFDIYSADALSGRGRHFQGVASNYLASRNIGARIHVGVRSTNLSFHLPANPLTPIIMVAAGTGLAPMRGFIQERAAIASARGSSALGPALLYFGCRDYKADYLYKSELLQWEKDGIVSLRPAFSRRGDPSQKTYGYAHERMWEERDEIAKMYGEGAKIFLCGSAGKLAKSTQETLVRIAMDKRPEKTQEECEAWLAEIREDRYVTDVFG